ARSRTPSTGTADRALRRQPAHDARTRRASTPAAVPCRPQRGRSGRATIAMSGMLDFIQAGSEIMVTVGGSRVQVRHATEGGAGTVARRAGELAQSFVFSRTRFDVSYPALLAANDACLLVAADGPECLGYLLGFQHLSFYANGPVGWVEEILVRGDHRGRSIGRALMSGF